MVRQRVLGAVDDAEVLHAADPDSGLQKKRRAQSAGGDVGASELARRARCVLVPGFFVLLSLGAGYSAAGKELIDEHDEVVVVEAPV